MAFGRWRPIGADGWPSGWVHASPDKVESEGDWTIVSGAIQLPGGTIKLRDAYRLENGIIRGTRRWTWTGKEMLPRCTLSVRWIVPGACECQTDDAGRGDLWKSGRREDGQSCGDCS